MSDVLIVDGLRTPRAAVRRGRGALSGVPPVELLGTVLRALTARLPLDPAVVEQVVVGCVTQTGEQGGNIAARAILAAGWSPTSTAETLNRYCASGLAAVNSLSVRIASGEVGLGLAGGVESMSRVPMGSDLIGPGAELASAELALADDVVPTGVAADILTAAHDLGRAELEAYAVLTQQRSLAARSAGRFGRSIVGVTNPTDGSIIDQDDAIRADTSAEALSKLDPAFGGALRPAFLNRARARWPQLDEVEARHTAATAPAMADAAALMVLASPSAAATHGLTARARLRATASVTVDSIAGPTAAIEAARLALARAGLSSAELDLAECHEAFAVTPLLFARALGLDAGRLNVNGGAIALGHPMGACGAILAITLLDELERRGGHYGLVAISGAAGTGAAAVIERLPVGAP